MSKSGKRTRTLSLWISACPSWTAPKLAKNSSLAARKFDIPAMREILAEQASILLLVEQDQTDDLTVLQADLQRLLHGDIVVELFRLLRG